MTNEFKTLVIVYQFGKVASTSLVRTLGQQQSLDVHQCHFLGESALQRIVPIAVGRSTSPYFHEHLSGQLNANVALTYKMNRVLSGEGAENLKVISLAREPLDWFRSSILQDISGYRAEICAFAKTHELTGADDSDGVSAGLVGILDKICEMLERLGGTRETVASYHRLGGQGMLNQSGEEVEPIVRRLFLLALRPLTWFQEHFRPCFEIGLDAFGRKSGFWAAHGHRADFIILRYENLTETLPAALADIGLDAGIPLTRDNVSRTKPFAKDVATAFDTSAGDKLRGRLLMSDYATFFGYDAEATATAAE